MRKEDLDVYLNKDVLVTTFSDSLLSGHLEYNSSEMYRNNNYMLTNTGSDYTYYFNEDVVEKIEEKKGE